MKRPTKVALENIAQKMVDDGMYIVARGTVNFMTEAVKIHKSMDSMVSVQTIKTHEQELEQMCQQEMLKRYPLNKGLVVPKQFEDDVDDDYEDDADIVLYDESGFEVDDSLIISVALAKYKRMMSHRPVKPIVPTKEYNMFYEGEDGLTWLKGNFKNQAVGTPGMRYVNKAGIVVTERTHAKYMLSQVPNSYTEYDVDVLTKVATGTYE
jgi:hypothetical protein